MRWPGAVTVYKNGVYCNLYVGNLIKRGDHCFNPTEPPEANADPAEGVEEPEPQGKEPEEAKPEEEKPEEEE